jgi:hypothetical protein
MQGCNAHRSNLSLASYPDKPSKGVPTLADIIFDNPPQRIEAQCETMLIRGHDVMVDSASRRRHGLVTGFRRALVHDQNDGLTINYNGDYPGGVTINGTITFTIHHVSPVTLQPREEVVQLAAVITELRAQITKLQNEVAALTR